MGERFRGPPSRGGRGGYKPRTYSEEENNGEER